MRRYQTITANDVGKPAIRAFGRTWLVANFIGRVLPSDVGKRVYLQESGGLQVEDDQQRARRRVPVMIRLVSGVCAYCKRPIIADFDANSTLDWATRAGDYGCSAHPLSTAEATFGHQPLTREALTLTDAVQRIFKAGERGDPYIAHARQLARDLGYQPYPEGNAS